MRVFLVCEGRLGRRRGTRLFWDWDWDWGRLFLLWMGYLARSWESAREIYILVICGHGFEPGARETD